MLFKQLIQIIKIVGQLLFQNFPGQLAFVIEIQIAEHFADPLRSLHSILDILQTSHNGAPVYFNKDPAECTGAQNIVILQMNRLMFKHTFNHAVNCRKIIFILQLELFFYHDNVFRKRTAIHGSQPCAVPVTDLHCPHFFVCHNFLDIRMPEMNVKKMIIGVPGTEMQLPCL